MYKYIKRGMDFTAALMLLTVLSPLMLVVAILIKLNRDGPVLFRQERPGLNGKVFTVLKFRTMSVRTHDKSGRELSDFERMSKIGSLLRKTSIDELPQFINILRGDMSFIGPRPLLTEYLEFYSPEQMRRHEVRPGISGWAQVNGRRAVPWNERIEMNVWYAEHMSLALDIKILAMTVRTVLSGKDNE